MIAFAFAGVTTAFDSLERYLGKRCS